MSKEEKNYSPGLFIGMGETLMDLDNHPNLGRYYGLHLYKDKEWWQNAFGVFTPEEKARVERLGIHNCFRPDYLLFLDRSFDAKKILAKLLSLDIIMIRVLPVDDNISGLSLGIVGVDVVFSGRDQMIKFANRHARLSLDANESWDDDGYMSVREPDINFMVYNSKVKMINSLRAIEDFKKIQNS